MLNYFLILLCIIVWPTVYCIFFREQISDWFANRFGRDKPVENTEGEILEVSLPFSYEKPQENGQK
ncbi:hypothetical protein [Gluconobacter morbifer]|nr:hypothetical protein [Gluconobacter morbifer]